MIVQFSGSHRVHVLSGFLEESQTQKQFKGKKGKQQNKKMLKGSHRVHVHVLCGFLEGSQTQKHFKTIYRETENAKRTYESSWSDKRILFILFTFFLIFKLLKHLLSHLGEVEFL